MDVNNIINKINANGENKILFAVYEDRMNLNLHYTNKANDEQLLKLYTFLKFYMKQIEKHLDETFENMYFSPEEVEK